MNHDQSPVDTSETAGCCSLEFSLAMDEFFVDSWQCFVSLQIRSHVRNARHVGFNMVQPFLSRQANRSTVQSSQLRAPVGNLKKLEGKKITVASESLLGIQFLCLVARRHCIIVIDTFSISILRRPSPSQSNLRRQR